jgi:spore maturation protein CgeB
MTEFLERAGLVLASITIHGGYPRVTARKPAPAGDGSAGGPSERILVTGDFPLHAHIDAGIEAGLRAAGHRVRTVCVSCLGTLGAAGLAAAEADLLLAVRGMHFPLDAPQAAKKVRCKAVWLTEEPHDVDRGAVIARHFDVALTIDRNTCGIHGPHKTWYLPLAVDPAVYRYEAVADGQRVDAAFVGGIFPERRPMLEAIYHLTADLSWRILGPQVRWEGDAAFASVWRNRRFSPQEAAIAYRAARIVLDQARDPAAGRIARNRLQVPATGVGIRPFEVTATGAFLLTDDSRADIFSLFPQGSVGIYRAGDAADCAAQIRWWLEHEEEREEAAAEARAWTLAHHTYAHRARELAEIVQAWLDTRPAAAPATKAQVLMARLKRKRP